MTADLRGVLVRARICLKSCQDAWEADLPLPTRLMERAILELNEAAGTFEKTDREPEVRTGTI